MRIVLLAFAICAVGCHASQLGNFERFVEGYREYTKLTHRLISDTELLLDTMRSGTTSSMEQLIKEITAYPQNNCTPKGFKREQLETSFKSQLTRFEFALKHHLLELSQKMDNIYSEIKVYESLAKSQFWRCYVLNGTCQDDNRMWLDGIVDTLVCRVYKKCANSVSKRSIGDPFTCTNGATIPRSWVCDGNSDCSDNSDEPKDCDHCDNGFRCNRTLLCIDKSKVCDGKVDCGDLSDEINCRKVELKGSANLTKALNCTMERGLHSCDGDKCIGLEQVCDHNRDCRDGSDEGRFCAKGVCPEECTKKGGVCFHGPSGPLCFDQCPLGTFDTLVGCSSQLYFRKSSIAELQENIPHLIARHNARLDYLKSRTDAIVIKLLANMMRCQDEELMRAKPLNLLGNSTESESSTVPSTKNPSSETPSGLVPSN